jgi:hypothetical protein
MSFIKNFFAFWYDFIVGDDWTVALGIVASLAVMGILAHIGLGSLGWLLMPLAVCAILAFSLARAVRAGEQILT